MKIKSIASLGLVLALLLTACASPAATPQAETLIRLPMGYVPNVQYAPFYAAVERGYFESAGLEIEFDYSQETDGVALVGANQLQFAVVSAEQVLLARAQGLPVVYVLAWWQDYPVAVASMKDRGIQAPADLAGKKIGLPGLYGANYIGLRALLAAGGLQEADVSLDSIGYTQVEALVSGRVDAVSVYANNEPLQLQRQGYELNVMRVADYTHLISNGLITNEKTIAENPELVRRMVQAVMQGIAYAVGNPDDTFLICEKHVEGLKTADQVVQREVLNSSIEFWKGKNSGLSDAAAWENMQTVLLDMGLLKQPLDLARAYTNDFVLAK
ncbi:MAG: ABC transporter substrate-binding protein [Chloroflexota bacterium]